MLRRRRQTSAGGCQADHAVPVGWRPEAGAGGQGPRMALRAAGSHRGTTHALCATRHFEAP